MQLDHMNLRVKQGWEIDRGRELSFLTVYTSHAWGLFYSIHFSDEFKISIYTYTKIGFLSLSVEKIFAVSYEKNQLWEASLLLFSVRGCFSEMPLASLCAFIYFISEEVDQLIWFVNLRRVNRSCSAQLLSSVFLEVGGLLWGEFSFTWVDPLRVRLAWSRPAMTCGTQG